MRDHEYVVGLNRTENVCITYPYLKQKLHILFNRFFSAACGNRDDVKKSGNVMLTNAHSVYFLPLGCRAP